MINPIYSPAPGRYESGIRYRRCGRSGQGTFFQK